ncbi:MAG: SMP-30/gluconolactonase/LRE family protein [Micropepsaceae bacterium]
MKIECVADTRCILGEGPLWDEKSQCLYWVDIKAPAIWRLDPKTGETRSWVMPYRVGAIAFRSRGGLVAAMKPGFAFVDLEDNSVEVINRPEKNLPDNRFNDGACDAKGRFWAGTMDDLEKSPTGDLFRLDPDGNVQRFQAGFIITNGVRWNAEASRLYVVDSAARIIWQHSYNLEKGTPGLRRVFARLPEADGWPDGLCLDAADHLWGAHWGAGRITRYRPDGTVDRVLELPAPNVTSCCFGGTNLDTLYVTTARIGLSEEQLLRNPLAGGTFAVGGLGVQGRPSYRFAG